MKQSLLFMLALVFLVSCGGGGSKSNSRRKTKITEAQIQNVMDNQRMECASIDGSGCPSGVARLLILNKEDADNSSVCSGFMVNEDTLVTNQHCISSITDCNNTYVAIYNGSSYEKNKCKSIVKLLNDYSDPKDPRKKLDVAVVKLAEKYAGQTFQASISRPLTYDSITAWVVDHTGLDKKEPNLYESRITELKCYVSSDRVTASLLLEKCPAIDGNSGSPILNSSDDLVGVIWGGTAGEIDSSLNLDKRRELYNQAAATELRYFIEYID